MRSWQKVIDSVLRPARPRLEWCVAEREKHLASRRPIAERHARAKQDCERRIERSRAAVFVANDGVVPAAMNALEREWRRLSRVEADTGWMDLWARIAPAAWIDRKRWQDSAEHLRLDAAVALASDVDSVEAAEAAIDALRSSLAPWGTAIGPRTRFRLAEDDSEHCVALLAEPLRAIREVASAPLVEHAEQLGREVHDAVLLLLPERPLLARDVAHAAFVDCLWQAAEPTKGPSPVGPLRDLWTTGYVLSRVDASGVTLEIPPL